MPIDANELVPSIYALLTQPWPAGIGTSIESSIPTTPVDYSPPMVASITRYGASQSASDNSAAINLALQVSADGGPAAYIPPGIWKHTSPITCAGACSMYGMGQYSVLAPQGCNGLSFTNQGTSLAGRYFGDFVIDGSGVSAAYGITAQMTAASGQLVVGLLYRNIVVTGGFLNPVYGYGWWHTTFQNVQSFNNVGGFSFVEQSIKVGLRDCLIVKSPVATHGDGSTGLTMDQLAGVRPQDITATGCLIYGYDVGAAINDVLVSGLDNCDIDQIQSIGVSITTANGGCRVRNTWVNLANAAATNGIIVNNLGAANNDIILLDGNNVIASTASASSVGISVGGDQLAVTTTNNTIGSSSAPFVTGISITGNNAVAKFNSIYASATAVLVNSSATFVDVGPNVNQNGSATPLAFTSLTPANFRYNGSGSWSATLTGFASGGTGTLSWVAHEGMVSIVVPDAAITGTSNATTMTLSNLPQYLWPHSIADTFTIVFDSATASLGFVRVNPSTGVVTFLKDFAGDPFTNTGTKGLQGGSFTYAYL